MSGITLRDLYEQVVAAADSREDAATAMHIGILRIACDDGADVRLLIRGAMMAIVQTALIDHCGLPDDDCLSDAERHITNVLMETLLREIAKATES